MFDTDMHLSFTHSESKKIFFTSDTHFNHDREWVFKARGFSNIKEHNDCLIKNINELVRENDILFHLGDFFLNTQNNEDANEILNQINCKNILYLWGNHNSRVKQMYSESILKDFGRSDIKIYPHTVGKITYLGHYTDIMVNDQPIVLCHYPIYSWNQLMNGSWMLHGHEHCNLKEHGEKGTSGKILDVGLDSNLKPYSFDDLLRIMKNKKTSGIGFHKPKNIARVCTKPKQNTLDPQGIVVNQNLKKLGIENIEDVKIGKHIELHLKHGVESYKLEKSVIDATEQLLYNDIIEDYNIIYE